MRELLQISLSYVNFSYEEVNFKFSSYFNFLIGDNGETHPNRLLVQMWYFSFCSNY